MPAGGGPVPVRPVWPGVPPRRGRHRGRCPGQAPDRPETRVFRAKGWGWPTPRGGLRPGLASGTGPGKTPAARCGQTRNDPRRAAPRRWTCAGPRRAVQVPPGRPRRSVAFRVATRDARTASCRVQRGRCPCLRDARGAPPGLPSAAACRLNESDDGSRPAPTIG